MKILRTIAELRSELKRLQSQNQAGIGFVPTMGNLHAGHISLIEIAQQKANCVVVSIFVNPLQFGKNEDLANYPRTFEEDRDKLEKTGVNILFAPDIEEMYPDWDARTQNLGQSITISPSPIANELCGAARPGHFAGVATVVTKLFNIVRPDFAIFGKKDFQQLFIIRELVQQFNLPIEIMATDTVREPDGLAMSSRNAYLNPMQRGEAPRLYKALKLAVEAIQKGNGDYASIEHQTTQFLTQLGWIVDYVSVRSSLTLMPAQSGDTALTILGAARQGSTRLIDNIEFNL